MESPEISVHYVSEIFAIEPWQFRLRGDLGFWNALKKEFNMEKLSPSVELSPVNFKDLLENKICELYNIDRKDFLEKDMVYAQDYDDSNGMSSGFISLEW